MRVIVVDKCPRCESYRTGRFAIKDGREEDYIRMRFIKGDRVRFYNTNKDFFNSNNCFCAKCNATWTQKLTTVKMTDEEFNEYLHTHEFYEERNEILQASKDKIHIKTKEDKAKSWNVGLTIISWITGQSLKKYNPYARK